MSSTDRTLPAASLRVDAEKWRARAAADGGGIDRKAEATLALLDELDRRTAVIVALGGIICPRCEGQKYDVGSCGVCGNVGWLDANGEAIHV